MPTPPDPPRGRRPELDALRGLAALSVLLFHALTLNSATLLLGAQLGEVHHWAARLLVDTPLHVVWLGAEAVWLFFVLSGFVLTRMTMRPGFSWAGYYPSRLVRLYLPVAIAVLLAWTTYLYPHVPGPTQPQATAVDYPMSSVLHDMTLVGGTTSSLGVLWSLQWEIVFSLLLPLYVLLVRTRPVITGVVAAVACYLGWRYSDGALSYLPMFFVGTVLAHGWDRVERWTAFLARRRWWAWAAGVGLAVAAVLAMTSAYLVGRPLAATPVPTWTGMAARNLLVPVVVAGIVLLIVLVQTWPPLRALVSSRPFVYLGTISFSLYLVHLPLLVLWLYVVGPGKKAAAIGTVTSLVAAVVFYQLVERRAHAFSRRVGRRAATVLDRPATAAAAPAPDARPESAAPTGTDAAHPSGASADNAALAERTATR
ncbi:acyltransferase family protein [Cellulomonas algicola]|uniref:acyltransferase family protein n=1 Tax=Cellulomonas algicola TaxID=2071633 RepID=UPI001359CE63